MSAGKVEICSSMQRVRTRPFEKRDEVKRNSIGLRGSAGHDED